MNGDYISEWNPYESEDDFRVLLEKVMEDEALLFKAIMSFYTPNAKIRCCAEAFCYWQWITATSQQRCDALYSVLSK